MFSMFRRFPFPVLLLLATACGNALPDATRFEMPQIKSLTVTDITESGATLIASVTNEDLLVHYGFTIGEEAAGSSRNVFATLDGNLFTVTVNDLKDGCTYYFKAYIDNGSGLQTSSEVKTFTTLPRTIPDNPEDPDPQNPDNPDTPDNPDNPDPPDPPSGYVSIPDAQFRAWILSRYDQDGDGQLSTTEATRIGEIEINTDNISTLAGIEAFPSLVKLSASGTRILNAGMGLLTGLDLSGNPRLEHLYVPHNRISTIDLSPTPGLVQCEVCVNELTSLDVSMLKAVTLLSCALNQLTRMDFRGLHALDELHCDDNPLTEILLDNKILRYIDCSHTDVTTLDFSRCPKLNIADCQGCPNLTTIYLAKGQVLGTLRKDDAVKIVYKDE